MEDAKTLDQAKRANEARKTLKDFKQRHGQDLYKGVDARSHQPLIDKKKQKLQAKMRESKPMKNATGRGRTFGDKAMNKIQLASKPTKSKMIVKEKTRGPGGKKGGKGRR